MPDLNYSGSKNSATETLQPHADQQGEESLLLPFSGKLGVDEGLEWSQKDFQQTVDNCYKDKSLNPLSQLTETPPFPTPHVLAQFASKAYTDYKKRESDVDYEKRLELPDGWKLLTTAYNNSNANGYFGAAYWHPQHQQVVIAHRGTKPSSVGALWADFKGVMRNRYVGQMESASTFAQGVVEVLQNVNQKKAVKFQLFYTGHSLGGWLAQITTFTTKYLKTKENIFLKSNYVQGHYHPHTVVFDSPACQDMLSQMTDKLDVRLDGRSIDLEHLDITSYLSAPNLINACNRHSGTVYRIFTDLSDMSWWRKHTALYNLTTHSMDKMLEAFDPVTGQVSKDEKGKLKIQLVVDWPVTAGLSRGKEYKRFFKWARHKNNYLQEISDVNVRVKGYQPLRYQTKTYDERVSGLSVFCQQERQFLESYHWLRQLPDFFKPKELFSVMGDNQAQEKAEELLKCFELKNNKIVCTDGSALQALIAYVKRLLQLFPEIKEGTRNALSSDRVRNRVYQIETRRYIERINLSPLEINPEVLSVRGFVTGLRDFVSSDQQQVLQLQMVDRDECAGLIKVYQSLQKTNCLIEGQYTVLKLKSLLTLNSLVNFSALMLSTLTPHLLLMACDSNQLLNEEQNIIRTIFSTIKQKQNIKIILSTRSDVTKRPPVKEICREIFGKAFVTRDEHFTWADLTTCSKEKLLEKSVIFQGVNISLNELMSAKCAAAEFLQLGALLEGKELKIADPVRISNGYKEQYYIGRTFNHQTTINEDIFNDKDVRNSEVYLARSKQEFQQLCQRDPKRSVHWVEKDESGEFLFRQSRGSLKTLRKYIDTDRSHTYTDGALDPLLGQAQRQRVMVISDTAGMGKTTVLTYLAKQIKQNSPAKWVVRIDLNDHTGVLQTLKDGQINKKKAIDFVATKLLKLKRGLDLELFKQCCEQEQKVRIVIMFDGFDEISPFYKETVIGLLQAVRQTEVEQLWVTTRPHLRNDLEDKLQQLSYTLEPFSEEDQIEYLTKFWSLQEWVTGLESKEKEENNKKLESYAKELIKKLSQSISDKEREFAGIPLQTRMLAETFEEEVKMFCRSSESMPALPFRLELHELYGRFIERKYDIYQEEKFKVTVSNVITVEKRKRDSTIMREDHQLLAFKLLFDRETVALFQDNRRSTFSAEQLSRIGIAQVSSEGKPHFIHRTFAEYHVADCLMKHLTKGNNTSQQVQTFVLTDIFLRDDYQVIRAFINCLLPSSDPSDVLKQYGNRIHELGEYGVQILHKAVGECNTNIIKFLLDSVEAGGHTDTLNELLLKQDKEGQTAWHKAALGGNIQVLEQLCAYADKKLTTEEVNNKLLLAKEREGQTVLHFASKRGNIDILENLWMWALTKMTGEDLYDKLLLDRDIKGKTAWHVAAEEGKLQVLQTLWEWAKEALTPQELKNELLISTVACPQNDFIWPDENSTQLTALQKAAQKGKTEVFLKIWGWAKEELTTEEIKNEVLLAEDDTKQIVWHMVARNGNTVLLEALWEWARENLTTEELSKKLLFAKDDREQTAFHGALECGKTAVLEKMWEWSKEIQTAEEINKLLLLAKDEDKETAFHCAVRCSNTDALQKLWEWGKETMTAEEIKSTFLLADIDEKVLYIAARVGHRGVLQKLWEWAKQELTAGELKDKFLLVKSGGQSAFHVAAGQSRLEALEELWVCAKELLTKEELIDKLLLAKDSMGKTAWHDAAEKDYIEVQEMLWEWAKEELTPEQVNRNLLLGKDCGKRTAWHLAARQGYINSLLKVWEWAKKELTTEELHNSFLLATDNKDRTAWHVAIDYGRSEILQGILDCVKNELNPEKLYNELLLAKLDRETTAWHVTANLGNAEMLTKFWQWAKETHTAQNLNNNLLLARDQKERTALHVATLWDRTEVVEKLWEFANEETTPAEVNTKLLLATDNFGVTAWHIAIFGRHYYLFEQLWQWAKDKLSTDDLKYQMCLAKHAMGRIAWHHAAEANNTEALETLWEWGKEELTTEELRNKLLLAKDDEQRNAWHLAAKMGHTESLEKIWEWAKAELSAEELNSKFLLAKDSQEMTAWHVAAGCGNIETLKQIWEWAKHEIRAEDLKNKLLLAKDGREMTAFDVAVGEGNFEVLEILQQWAVEEITPEELSNISCLSTNLIK